MTREEMASLEAELRDGYRKKYKPNARQEALYDFLTSKPFTKENPATQREVIAGVLRADGTAYYSSNPTRFNNDLCRAVFGDVDALNFSEGKDRIIGRTDDYRYYVVQDRIEKDELLRAFLTKSILARMRYEAIQRKASMAGQGKLLASTPDAHPLTDRCKPFREPLPENKLEQGSIFDTTWKGKD